MSVGTCAKCGRPLEGCECRVSAFAGRPAPKSDEWLKHAAAENSDTVKPMSQNDQIDAFETDLNFLISRYVDEFDLPAAAMVGVLQMKIFEVLVDTYGVVTESDEEDPRT